MLNYPIVRSALALSIAAAALAACGDKAKTADSASAAGEAPMAAHDSTMPGMMKGDSAMRGMQGSGEMAGMAMTGDADRDFLRMMSDHHKGLSEMAHGAREMKLPVAADAKRLDTMQDAERDKMVTMLEKDYNDAYAPKVMPSNQAMIDALKGKTGADYERTFYQNVVQHHEEALKMIDDYLPKAKKAAVKAMAEKMKTDQTREIAEFKRKAAKGSA